MTERTLRKLPSGFSKWDYHLNPFERDKLNSMSLAVLCSSLRKKKKKKACKIEGLVNIKGCLHLTYIAINCKCFIKHFTSALIARKHLAALSKDPLRRCLLDKLGPCRRYCNINGTNTHRAEQRHMNNY